MEYLLYVLIGFLVAALGTLIGAGGGIIFVPLFLYMFPQWDPYMVAGTSLTIVMANAISGSLAYIKQKKVLYGAAIMFSVATLPGSVIGAIWSNYFNGSTFKLSFGILLLFISALIGYKNFNKGKQKQEVEVDMNTFTYNKTVGILISFVVGFISSIFGIGGGVIHVPALVYVLSFPAHVATATSHFILAISSIVGFGMHFFEQHINFTVAISCSIGAIIGAQVGAKISKRTKARAILLILSGALALLAFRLIYVALG